MLIIVVCMLVVLTRLELGRLWRRERVELQAGAQAHEGVGFALKRLSNWPTRLARLGCDKTEKGADVVIRLLADERGQLVKGRQCLARAEQSHRRSAYFGVGMRERFGERQRQLELRQPGEDRHARRGGGVRQRRCCSA